MSVLSTLGLLVTAASAKLRPEREDPARAIAELEAQRDDWRARAEAWRARAITNIPPTQELQWYAAAQQLAQQNQAYQQQNAKMVQQNLYQQGLLGAQGLNPELFCNCVPSRAQVWAARPDGA